MSYEFTSALSDKDTNFLYYYLEGHEDETINVYGTDSREVIQLKPMFGRLKYLMVHNADKSIAIYCFTAKRMEKIVSFLYDVLDYEEFLHSANRITTIVKPMFNENVTIRSKMSGLILHEGRNI